MCRHMPEPCSTEACWLTSSWRARCTDRACNHGKLPSPELKLRLLLLPQDLFTEPNAWKRPGEEAQLGAGTAGGDGSKDWPGRPWRVVWGAGGRGGHPPVCQGPVQCLDLPVHFHALSSYQLCSTGGALLVLPRGLHAPRGSDVFRPRTEQSQGESKLFDPKACGAGARSGACGIKQTGRLKRALILSV